MKKVVVIGAGPGGLSAAMLLAHQGFEVAVYEKANDVGGRNRCLQLGAYRFDTGPTFWSMVHLAKAQFALIDRRLEDYLTLTELPQLYELYFADGTKLAMLNDETGMVQNLASQFPGSEREYAHFMRENRARLAAATPILRSPMQSWRDYARWEVIKGIPQFKLTRTLADELARWFTDEKLQLAFGFQAKYLGMSPKECPAIFSILAFMEHEYGIMHVQGGLFQLSQAMAKIVREGNGQIYLNQPVRQVIVENGCAKGIELADGTRVSADYVILNEDFAQAMNEQFSRTPLKKYAPEQLAKKKYSCSTFMCYLGLDTTYPEVGHHSIIFSDDYEASLQAIFGTKQLPESPSVYVQNAGVSDASLAPKGHSTLYLLAPMPNNQSQQPWDDAQIAKYRQWLIERVEAKLGIAIQGHIVAEHVMTPRDWEQKYNVYEGAVFNLSHQLTQLLMLRPHNQFEEVERVYLVGGGTHPGSGLPTILESGRISAELVKRAAGSE